MASSSGNVVEKVTARAHHAVMTEMESRYSSEAGRKPSRLLSCEFFDNSISALCRQLLLPGSRISKLNHGKAIELHCFYGPASHTINYDHLEFMAILDKGPGMDVTELRGWAEMAHKTKDRREKDGIRGADNLEKDNQKQDEFGFELAPYQADARTGHFGKGSKSAGFYFGKSVEVHTKSASSGGNLVHMMTLDEDEFDRKSAQGQDWQKHDLRKRSASSTGEREAAFPNERWQPLLELVKKADECESYTLFLIRKIRPARKDELPLDFFPAMVSELRDMFMVYCDGIDIGLHGLEDDRRATPLASRPEGELPPSVFKYSQLHVNVIAHLRPSAASMNGGNFKVMHRISLRDDAPSIDWSSREGVDWDAFRKEHRLWEGCRLPKMDEVEDLEEGMRGGTFPWVDELKTSLKRSPTRLLELCAPEPFYFRVQHREMGAITGIAVYMPTAEGVETKDQVQLHDTSVAFCFWKGRQMPYAKLANLLPFMFRKGGDADDRKMRDRVRLLLFFGAVAQVDDCKFKFNDDIEELLNPTTNRRFDAPQDPYTNFQKWNKDARKWTKSAISQVTKDLETWLSNSHENYDRSCVLGHRMQPEEVAQLEAESAGKWKADKGKTYFGAMKWGAGLGRVTVKRGEKIVFDPKGLKVEASYAGAKQVKRFVGTPLCFQVDTSQVNDKKDQPPATEFFGASPGVQTATCTMILRREPAELYGQLYPVSCNRLVSNHTAEVMNIEKNERAKAPSALLVDFYDEDGAPLNQGTKDKPLVVRAGEDLPVVCVRVQNSLPPPAKADAAGDSREVTTWLRANGTSHGPLQLRQRVLHAGGQRAVDGYEPVTSNTGASTKWADPSRKKEIKAFPFNDGATVRLQLTKAGDFVLHYELLPIRPGQVFRDSTDRAAERQAPSAKLHVRVQADKATDMKLKLMQKTENDETGYAEADELVLGRRYAIDVTFCDEHGNPCTVDRKALKNSTANHMFSVDEEIRQGRPPPHFISADGIRLEYQPGETEDDDPVTPYPAVGRFLPGGKEAKGKPVTTVRTTWGAPLLEETKDYRQYESVVPTPEAIQEHKFSRDEPQPLVVKVCLLLPDPDDPHESEKYRMLQKELEVMVRSDAPLRLQTSASTLSASAAEAKANQLFNFTHLPKLTFRLEDEYGCTATAGEHRVLQLSTEPPCHLDGMSVPFPAGKSEVRFEQLTLKLDKEQLETPIKMSFSYTSKKKRSASDSSAGAGVSVEGWLSVLPSGRPQALQLEMEGADGGFRPLASIGKSQADDVDVYFVQGPARSPISGLRLLPVDETGAAVRHKRMEVRVQGREIKGAEHATWVAEGVLPQRDLRMPSDCSVESELTVTVGCPAEKSAPGTVLELRLKLQAEAGAPSRFEFHGANGVLGRSSRGAEVLRVQSGGALSGLLHVRLTDDDGNLCDAPADLAAELRLSGSADEGPWFQVGKTRSRKLRLGSASEASAGFVRTAKGELELRCSVVGPKQANVTLTIAEGGDGDSEGEGEDEGEDEGRSGRGSRASTRGTPATALADKTRSRLGIEEKLVSFELLEGEPDCLYVVDDPAFKQALTRECFQLRLEVRDAMSNELPVGELKDIQLSVESAGDERVSIQWGDSRSTEGKISDRSGQVAGNQLMLRHVAWRAPRAIAKLEHTLKVCATLNGKKLYGEREFKTGCTDRFVSQLVAVKSSSEGSSSGASGAEEIVEEGPPLVAGQPAPKVMVRAVMDGQDGKHDRRLLLLKPNELRLPPRKGESGAEDATVPIVCELELFDRGKSKGAAVPLRHQREGDNDHFELDPAAHNSWCAGGALLVGGPKCVYKVFATYHEERPKIADKLSGPAAGERTLSRKQIFEFAVSAGAATEVRLLGVPARLECNNKTHTEMAPKLKLQLVDAHGNAAASADGEPLLRLEMRGVDATPAGATLPALVRESAAFKPFGEAGTSECLPPEIQSGSGKGNSKFELYFCGSTALALPVPLLVQFTDAQALEAAAQLRNAQQMEQKKQQAEQLEEKRRLFDQLQDEQTNDARRVKQLREGAAKKLQTADGAMREAARSCAHFVNSGLARSLAGGQAAADQFTAATHYLAQRHGQQLFDVDVVKVIDSVDQLMQATVHAMQQVWFRPRTGYNEQDAARILDAKRAASQNNSIVYDTVANLWQVQYCGPYTKTIAALLSDFAGPNNMRAVVTDTKRAGDLVRQRVGSAKIGALEFFQPGHVNDADPRALQEAARSLGLSVLDFPAGKNAANFLTLNLDVVGRREGERQEQFDQRARQTDLLVQKVRDSFLSGALIFANETQGAAYKKAHNKVARGKVAILCLDGFHMSAAGWYGGSDGSKKTDLAHCQQHFGMEPAERVGISQQAVHLQHLLGKAKHHTVDARELHDQSRAELQSLQAQMAERQRKAQPLGIGELSNEAEPRRSGRGFGASPAPQSSGATRERADGAADQSRADALRQRH